MGEASRTRCAGPRSRLSWPLPAGHMDGAQVLLCFFLPTEAAITRAADSLSQRKPKERVASCVWGSPLSKLPPDLGQTLTKEWPVQGIFVPGTWRVFFS